MALRMIYKSGESVLRKKAKPVTKFDRRLAILLTDMRDTLTDANGIGLAAQQVGILKRVVLIDAGKKRGIIELINPAITSSSGRQTYYEGCLSFPGYYGDVGRPEEVVVSAFDRHGRPVVYRATKLYAVACCHELDHLEGELFQDKVLGKLYTKDEIRKMREDDDGQSNGGAAGVGNAQAGGAAQADSGDIDGTDDIDDDEDREETGDMVPETGDLQFVT